MDPETLAKIGAYSKAIEDGDLNGVKELVSDPVKDIVITSDIRNSVRDKFRVWLPGSSTDTFIDNCIMRASELGRLEIVKYLHENGANIKIKDEYCFRWAVYYARYEVVEYLINNGANIYVEDSGAFKDARAHQDKSILNLLLEFERKSKLEASNDIQIMDTFMNSVMNRVMNVSLETYLETLKSLGIEFSFKRYRKEFLLKLGNGDWIFITEKIYKVAPDDVLQCINDWSEEVADWDWVGTIIQETKEFEAKYPKIIIGHLRWKIHKLNSKITTQAAYIGNRDALIFGPPGYYTNYNQASGYITIPGNSITITNGIRYYP